MWSFSIETEFHELELLDEINKLKYEGKLPDVLKVTTKTH